MGEKEPIMARAKAPAKRSQKGTTPAQSADSAPARGHPPLPPLRVAAEDGRDLERALALEWLETNGLGGYASGTCAGAHTRRYHGLLIAAVQPPTARTLLLHSLQESLAIGGETFELSTNLYHPDVVHPSGYRFLQGFSLDPFPTWVFEVPGAWVRKTVFLPHGRNAVVVRYRVQRLGDAPVTLTVRPLVSCRDHHQELHANDFFRGAVEGTGDLLRVSPYEGQPALNLAHGVDRGGSRFQAGGGWYYNFRHPAENARGLSDREDAYCIGAIEHTSADDSTLSLIAWTEPHGLDGIADVDASAAKLEAAERTRRSEVAAWAEGESDDLRRLAVAADQFLVARGSDTAAATVIAGYPWFTDWGRDTLISLPGLTLVTRRFETARSILRTFIAHLDRGMVPNYFPDAGQQPEYNTVDATLWLFHAVDRYLAYTSDLDFAREVFEALVDVMRWHVRGTRYGIRVDGDGLLTWDAPGVQLTWMDAKVGDWVVTPRRGKAVEINALWFNALNVVERWATRLGDRSVAREARDLAAACRLGFEAFWNPERGCLYDVLTPDGPDASLRPNQIFAASLPSPLISGDRARAMLATVERELLTPIGLRSLAPSDPAYRGHYGGNQTERDGAYHQGTVWAWLLGPFVSAHIAHAGDSRAAARQRGEQLLAPLLAHTHRAGLGSVSEIFDGDEPFTPNGCPWQAWSVAELLRAWVEDVRGTHA